MLKDLKETIFKALKKSVKTIPHQIENIWWGRHYKDKPNRNSEVEEHNNSNEMSFVSCNCKIYNDYTLKNCHKSCCAPLIKTKPTFNLSP